jgi:hypothetical protein
MVKHKAGAGSVTKLDCIRAMRMSSATLEGAPDEVAEDWYRSRRDGVVALMRTERRHNVAARIVARYDTDPEVRAEAERLCAEDEAERQRVFDEIDQRAEERRRQYEEKHR